MNGPPLERESAFAAAAPPASAALGPPSMRERISRFVLLLSLTWIVVATVVLALWLHHEVNELLDDGLAATTEALALVLNAGGSAPASAPASVPASANTAEPLPATAAAPPASSTAPAAAAANDETPFAWQLLDAQGRVLLRSPNAPAHRLAERLAEGFVVGPPGWRVRGRRLSGERWLLVGQETRERLEATLEVAGGSIAAALLTSLAGLAALRWRLARETEPLAQLREVLARYDPLHAAGPKLPPPALQELVPVHEAVQQLGERLAAHAAAERAFSAHAAHALRTPLAGLEAQLAVAQREATPALQPRLARLRGATRRLSHVVGALLALFRSSSGAPKRVPVDVASLLERVPLEGLVLSVEGAARPSADADLLAAALINLLDNSVRHGARQVRVQVQAAQVTLIDDGPGVSAARLQQLRQALEREDAGLGVRDESGAALAAAATGLGLALADRVARVHGGRLELLAAEQGFAVRLWLQAPVSPTTTMPTLAPASALVSAPTPMPDLAPAPDEAALAQAPGTVAPRAENHA